MRVEWMKVHQCELFCMIADLTPTGWEFSEKSTWDIRWYLVRSTPELVKKAETLARIQEHTTLSCGTAA